MKKKLPKSTRKFIRREKARIRREIFCLGKQKEQIKKLYEEILKKPKIKKYDNKRNI